MSGLICLKIGDYQAFTKGESAVSTAPIYDVGRTTVNDIKKNANKIESHNISKLQNSDSSITAKKIVKKLYTRTARHRRLSVVYSNPF